MKVRQTELIAADTTFYKSEIARLEKEKKEAFTRVWTIHGTSVRATFESEKDGKVSLRVLPNNTMKTFDVSAFSEENRAWIDEMKAAK